MIIQNIHNPNVRQEISKSDWEKLGKSQKVFRVLDATDSKTIKEQIIGNTVSSKKTFSERLEEKSKEILEKKSEKKEEAKKVKEEKEKK